MKKKRMMYLAVFLICAACTALLFSFAVVVYEIRWPTVTLTYPEDFTEEEIILDASNLTIDCSGSECRISVNIYSHRLDECDILVDIYNNPEDPTFYEHFIIRNYTHMDSLVVKATEFNDRIHVGMGGSPPICNRARFHLYGGDDVFHIGEVEDLGGQQRLASGPVMVYCDPGNDIAVGQDGRNWLYGQDGNDILLGKGDTDYIYGGPGDDWCIGGSGNDFIWGYEGNDTIIGGSGNDYCAGGPGDDRYFGGPGEDSFVDSAPGNDWFDSGEGDDDVSDPGGELDVDIFLF